MVRRLVKHEQVRFLREQAREVRAHDPAAAERARGFLEIGFLEGQALENALGLGREAECAAYSSSAWEVASVSTLSSPTGALSCGRNPSVEPRSRITLPSSGEFSPSTSENSVDLPAPFGPTRPMRSPRLTCNEALRKSTRPPNDLVRLESVSMESNPPRKRTHTLLAGRPTRKGRVGPNGVQDSR